MASQGKQQPDLMQYLADAANFSTFFAGSPAAKSTPHLYISALSTWHQQSPVWTHWKHQFCFIPSILLKCAITVPLLTMTQATNSPIKCIALSENGDFIASGSWDKSVQVWDAKTGEQLRELKGHTNQVTSVAFSPDGNQIVSGSWDQSVRVWDAKTGEQLRKLQGHTSYVTSVAFSPDCQNLRGSELRSRYRGHMVKTRLQLMCCTLVWEPGCLGISESWKERVSGKRCGMDRET